MSNSYNRDALIACMYAINTKMQECKEELNTADGKLGDGDLGITMTRGMAAICEEVNELPDDLGMALFKCGKCFTQISGSSLGTLLATGLMAAGKKIKGQTQINCLEVSSLFGVAVEAMIQRGKASLGDKTILDILDGLHKKLDQIDDPQQQAKTAVLAVHEVLDEFRDQEAKVGRARMYGEKSKGLDDPGMLAITRAVESVATIA